MTSTVDTMTHQDKITEAATELRREMIANYKRGSAGMPAAYAVNASDRNDWQIIVVPAGAEPPEDGTLIEPYDGTEPYCLGWLNVPFVRVRSVLELSAMRAGILPRLMMTFSPEEWVGGNRVPLGEDVEFDATLSVLKYYPTDSLRLLDAGDGD